MKNLLGKTLKGIGAACFLHAILASSPGQADITLSADYLYWRGTQTGMSYAIGGNFFEGQDTRDFIQSFDWSSGVRLGIEYDCPCSNYDISFQWTHFHNTSSGHDSDSLVIATELLNVNTVFIIGTEASADWDLDFDTFDLNFEFCPFSYCHCAFQPYLGLKGGIINQTQTIHYNNFVDTSTEAPVNAEVRDINNFYGAGPKIGIDLDYSLRCGLSFVGDFAAAFFCGHAHNPTKVFLDDPIGSGGSFMNFAFEQDQIIPMLQILLGLHWTTSHFYCFDIDLGVGYEAQFFWNTWRNQNSFVQDVYITDAGYGDLTLQGLTAHLGVRF